ncbi:ribonuclease H-like domain-containing protein [Tanacetum coccineum]
MPPTSSLPLFMVCGVGGRVPADDHVVAAMAGFRSRFHTYRHAPPYKGFKLVSFTKNAFSVEEVDPTGALKFNIVAIQAAEVRTVVSILGLKMRSVLDWFYLEAELGIYLSTGKRESGVRGHPTDQFLSILHNDLKISKFSSVHIYEICHRAKQTRDAFPLSSHKSKTLGQFGYTWSDNGTEFVNNKMSKLFSKLGIIHQTSSFGEVERYKVKLVAKDFSQREGFDYDETFSPVVKMLDVNNTFLYGDLVGDVYMTLSQGYDNVDKSKVCKLAKSLYGLKQAPRQWNAKLTTTLAEHGFEQSKFDYSFYIKQKADVFVALLVYVDDIVITSNDESEIKYFKEFFSTKFLIKDLGILKYFLCIEILENENGLCMSHRKYCLELLYEYGLLAARPVDIPLPENSVLCFEESENGNQHIHSPLQSHFKASLRVLRYLKGSPGCGIEFNKCFDLKLRAFAHADWEKCPKTRNIGIKGLYHVDLNCDNSSVIQIAANPVFHERTKQFELDVHFVSEKVMAGIIKSVKIHTNL